MSNEESLTIEDVVNICTKAGANVSFEVVDKNKLDQGKLMGGVLQDFLPALKKVAELGSMNNKPFGKYDRGSWLLVENAEERYLDAFWRHQLDGMYNVDPTTGHIHLVAMAWNLLALLVFYERNQNA